MDMQYFNGKSWSDVTRDERTFCMYLYSIFKDDPKDLLGLIKRDPTFKKLDSDRKFSFSQGDWELGYEVCFYRDFLLQHDVKVKEDADKIKSWGIEMPSKLIKRTFDLCLFSKNEIIIIEAKCAENLTSDQFNDFLEDKDYIETIFKALGLKVPNIQMVVLASAKYFDSKSFSSSKGVGRKYILDQDYITGLLSWKFIHDQLKGLGLGTTLERKMMRRADDPNKKPSEEG
mgnify:CR=1 FL=1